MLVLPQLPLGRHDFHFLAVRRLRRDGVRGVMNITDAIFVCYKDRPILETGSPNKFFDGLAAGKLIVINFGGWIKKEIEEYKCGVTISKSDPSDFINKIRTFITDPDRLKEYQVNSRKLDEQKYDRKLLIEKWISFLLAR